MKVEMCRRNFCLQGPAFSFQSLIEVGLVVVDREMVTIHQLLQKSRQKSLRPVTLTPMVRNRTNKVSPLSKSNLSTKTATFHQVLPSLETPSRSDNEERF